MDKEHTSKSAENRKIRVRIASTIAAFAVFVGLFTVGLIILPFIILILGGVIAYS